MYFEIINEIEEIGIIAVENSIREIERLKKKYGEGRWRKLKGTALVRLQDGTIEKAEIHWYEANGIGQKDFKIKRLLR
ncbi:MAG: hypothetical protein COZ80_11125 [Ignavibacteria bacterium CG_4_8_14_3_um_filter_37_9]|nr:hypothetical protein [Ignavibacteria bacterium]OIO23418.1 MAG: hypothetical protein AUJ54_01720 [Ignavibacteria bacterium CG1_02_37_35]PIW98337.1 MAG: hypothetical protein COZ80_11125 [Ignavibacteria bacterium CG_4_8_14_3_um_filter_37_9]PJC57540.1 MAG: hypothetical protein CO025_12860 [Ignavibacteria bacterium CG_4_9_14_0_2_um_filter_37_13]